jgi:hypothetical protein
MDNSRDKHGNCKSEEIFLIAVSLAVLFFMIIHWR